MTWKCSACQHLSLWWRSHCEECGRAPSSSSREMSFEDIREAIQEAVRIIDEERPTLEVRWI